MIWYLWNGEGSGPFLHVDVFLCAPSSAEALTKKAEGVGR